MEEKSHLRWRIENVDQQIKQLDQQRQWLVELRQDLAKDDDPTMADEKLKAAREALITGFAKSIIAFGNCSCSAFSQAAGHYLSGGSDEKKDEVVRKLKDKVQQLREEESKE